MHIVVTIKQVPDTNEVRIDQKTGTLIREGVPSIMNPEDKNALEAALRIKEDLEGVTVTVLSMGPPQAGNTLMEALCMGADQAYLVCDRAFAGADTLATAYTLAMALKKLKPVDLVLCGSQAIDGDTAQVGPQIAECLGLPQITYAERITASESSVDVESRFGNTLRRVSANLPALVTVGKSINRPRYKTMNGIAVAFRDKTVHVLTSEDIRVNPSRIGLTGSPTSVRKTFVPELGRTGEIVEGGPDTLSLGIIRTLETENLLSKA
ncbi:MAG: electron transfer flavoprotein subunit beta/FixA family protein [Desulfobacterales bacterium]|nr:electron transfer flavoprotein subunit beta/FixA family protein [Desulfobacterales bacterium]